MSGKEIENSRSDLPQLLYAKDVARVLGISVKMVHKMVREGKLGCVQITAKDRRFTQQQLLDYIDLCSKNRPVDTRTPRKVRLSPSKGGEKSSRFFDRANLLKEIRSWQ
jgi:hypothetical protein